MYKAVYTGSLLCFTDVRITGYAHNSRKMKMPTENHFGTDGVPSDDVSSDPELRSFGLMSSDDDEPPRPLVVERVIFVDDPEHPRGTGRLDLATGERIR